MARYERFLGRFGLDHQADQLRDKKQREHACRPNADEPAYPLKLRHQW